MTSLTDTELGLLTLVITINGWHLTPPTIMPAARLLERGLVTAENGYDGLQVVGTEAGVALAERLGLIVKSDSAAASLSGWDRTSAGTQVANNVSL